MKKIFILGSGRSTSALIQYLEKMLPGITGPITIGDRNDKSVEPYSHSARRIQIDVFNDQQLGEEIQDSDLVISMMPAMFHPVVARACLQYGKSLLTASYVSQEMAEMETRVKVQGLIIFE